VLVAENTSDAADHPTRNIPRGRTGESHTAKQKCLTEAAVITALVRIV